MSLRFESPIPLYAIPRVWLWIEPIRERVFSDSGPQSADEFIAQEYDPAIRTWAIAKDGEIAACALIHNLREPGVVSLRLFWRDAGVVVEALRHIVEADLFADEKASIRRIELRAWRDSPNVLSLCRQAGGVREAILQQSATRDGRPKDQMLIAWVKE